MKKGLIFCGPSESGKSRKAIEIAANFKSVVFICQSTKFFNQDPFIFSGCDNYTELIVVDEIKDINDVEHFFSAFREAPEGGLHVNRRYQCPIKINPLILIVCSSDILISDIPKSSSIDARFDIIEFPTNEEISFKELNPNQFFKYSPGPRQSKFITIH